MTIELVRLPLAAETDVFAARQRAREAAALLGLDNSDEVRVATAVSELGRVIVATDHVAVMSIGVSEGWQSDLVIVITSNGALDSAREGAPAVGLAAGRRLMDSVIVRRDDPLVVEMTKALPVNRAPLDADGVAALRSELAGSLVSSPFDELRAQNLELVSALGQLTDKQEELLRLNEELAETNRGVMAMYSQLSAELAETNRGVVALYAELDERGVQLHQVSEAKSRFLASVSHELRSPLNSVLALAQLLREPDSGPLTAAQRRQVELISLAAGELLARVNDLLDLARAESGRLDPQPRPLDLDALLSELCATLRPLAANGVELVLEIDEHHPNWMETDSTLLAQLVRNLVTNALKFTEKGEVRVATLLHPSSNLLSVIVSDTGIGIAAEHQELVFEEFFQVPGPLQRRVNSTGLGLAYARRVADALGGTLELSSELGAGSTFTLILPIQWAKTPLVSSGSQPGSEPAMIDTALVVDDEASFRLLLRQMLQGVAVRVIEAENAGDALALMRQARPDVVLLDLRMAGGDGEEVLAAASSEDALREIPIAVITSVELDGAALRRLSRAFAVVSKAELTRASLLGAIDSIRAVVAQ
jgi:signal transduction histidine kinase